MPAVFRHTNIVSHDPDRLARFYIDVFGCEREGPERHLSGDWIERGTGLAGATITGVMLRLPGFGQSAPRLEIFRVAGAEAAAPAQVTRPGLMHLCFEVDDAQETLDRILAAGGRVLGEIVDSGEVPGVGRADFVYARDPDDNIVELIAWNRIVPAS
ncbi:VOC family protein [Novosphingobium colocasiae]|uniref:VOC family protein n=1 Tax=Novosphingobium colocasiae TaxID=1256513 RepID=UPI0035B09488